MASGVYTDINYFPCWLDSFTEFFLHRGKNCFLQKQAASLWTMAEENNLQTDGGLLEN